MRSVVDRNVITRRMTNENMSCIKHILNIRDLTFPHLHRLHTSLQLDRKLTVHKNADNINRPLHSVFYTPDKDVQISLISFCE